VRHTQLVNYTLYQIGWFACVLGAASQRLRTGCLIGTILVGVHVALTGERVVEGQLVVLATAVGAAVEMIQIAAGTYRFTSGTVTDALPPPVSRGVAAFSYFFLGRFSSLSGVVAFFRLPKKPGEREAASSGHEPSFP
jgi:hypothetical protein